MSVFDARARETGDVLEKVSVSLQKHLADDASRILRDTCIYVVGSGGRGEMSRQSDVDLFVARVGRAPSDVDAFQVRQAVTRAFFEMQLPDPSQGGEFLKMHTAQSLCERMGTPHDDATNTFTARMLLLLESRPLLGKEAYEKLIAQILKEYWRDEEGHENDFQPFVLLNDIVRYWRVLLLNYVAKIAEKEIELKASSPRGADRRLRSYKLRFSRCMTCFSFLAMLLARTRTGAVTRESTLEIVLSRPTARLHLVAELVPKAKPFVEAVLEPYAAFLQQMETPKNELLAAFDEESFRSARSADGYSFGKNMFELIQALSSGAQRAEELFRHIVV